MATTTRGSGGSCRVSDCAAPPDYDPILSYDAPTCCHSGLPYPESLSRGWTRHVDELWLKFLSSSLLEVGRCSDLSEQEFKVQDSNIAQTCNDATVTGNDEEVSLPTLAEALAKSRPQFSRRSAARAKSTHRCTQESICNSSVSTAMNTSKKEHRVWEAKQRRLLVRCFQKEVLDVHNAAAHSGKRHQ